MRQLSYIGADLGNTAAESWILNSLALVATVLSPVVASASDSFQARKPILLVCSTLSFIGASIAPGSKDIYRLIGAQILLGFGLAIVPITYAIFSEILPKRWRPSKCLSFSSILRQHSTNRG
jgi:MFS family permease